MDGSKQWWASRGMWGALATIVTGVGLLVDVAIDAQAFADAMAQVSLGLGNIVTGVVAWIGRKQATQTIN